MGACGFPNIIMGLKSLLLKTNRYDFFMGHESPPLKSSDWMMLLLY